MERYEPTEFICYTWRYPWLYVFNAYMLGLSLLVQEGAMPTSSLMRAADTEQSKEDVRAAAAATPDDGDTTARYPCCGST